MSCDCLKTTSKNHKRKGCKCFDCGKEGCTPATCSEPIDEARVERNKKIFLEAKAKRRAKARRSKSTWNQQSKKKCSALADGTPLLKGIMCLMYILHRPIARPHRSTQRVSLTLLAHQHPVGPTYNRVGLRRANQS